MLVDSIRTHHPEKPVSAIEDLGDLVAVADLACNREGLACGFDWTQAEERKPIVALPPAVDQAINRVHGGIRTLEDKGRAFLLHVTARAPRWYATHAPEASGEDCGEAASDREVA